MIGRKISKEKKSNSRDKFIIFRGCDTELKHLIDINGECSDIAGGVSDKIELSEDRSLFLIGLLQRVRI